MIMSATAQAQSLAVSGVVETEGVAARGYDNLFASDVTLATVEVAVGGDINKNTDLSIVLLHEEDSGVDAEIDSASVNFKSLPMGSTFTAGRQYLPFGQFESNMISDPLTLELAETRESAFFLDVPVLSGGIGIAMFQGDVATQLESNSHPDYMVGLNQGIEFGAGSLNISAYYINSMAHSENIEGALLTAGQTTRTVPGMGYAVSLALGNTQLIGECVGAQKAFDAADLSFNGKGATPQTCHFEAGMSFAMAGKEATIAAGYQTSEQAFDALGLPKSRALLSTSLAINPNTTLAFEWANDTDYAQVDGGTGKQANTVTTQIAVSF